MQQLGEMSSANSTKFNANAAAFVPAKKDQRVAAANMSSQPTPTVTDQRSADQRKSKQRYTKQPKQANADKRSNVSLHDPFEEEILNGRTKPNSRRGQISINHLLDFQFEHDENHFSSPPKRLGNNRRRKSNGLGPKVHLSGDRYINVNYKFVVDHRGDYRPQILDTNLPVDRHNILRIVISKNDTQCPICLTDDLVAPRMTSCGHSFCLVCLLRYLDSEDPVPPKKNEVVKATNKLKDCPLCSKKIKPNETLPVLINPIDERYEVPKVGEEAILQLMYRPHNKVLAFPYQMKLRNPDIFNGNVPWFSSSDTRSYNSRDMNMTGNDLFQYSRLMKADVDFVVNNYLREIQDIRASYEEDKALYDDSGEYYFKAIKQIETAIQDAEESELHDKFSALNVHENSEIGAEISLEDLAQKQQIQTEFSDSNTYFFYQTSFNSKIRFFVSTLDNKILKALYGTYSNFPLCLKIKIQNIVHDFIINDELVKRFKFLSYLPHGTEVAFLELDWFEDGSKNPANSKKSAVKRKSFLPPEIYHQFQNELVSRSDKLRLKNIREEKSRRRYQDELEWKTREFYANENNFKIEDYGVTAYNTFDTLSLSGDDDPALGESAGREPEPTDNVKYETTVWGTKIARKEPESDAVEDDADDYFNELLRLSKEKEERKKQGKKQKKKLVLLTTGGQ